MIIEWIFEDKPTDAKAQLLTEIKKDPPNSHSLVVCLPGTNKAFFNTL